MKSLLPASLLLAVALMSSAVARPAAQSSPAAASAQTIDVIAKKYEFIPPAIRVKQGTRVQLKITATDHTHGFQISESPKGSEGKPGLIFSSPQECHKIEKGQTATIQFVAQTPGTYPFKCCVHCGLHHRSMKGELVVEP